MIIWQIIGAFLLLLFSLVIYGVKIKMAPSSWHRTFSGLAEVERVGWLWMWRSHLWLVLSLNPCHSGIFTSPIVGTISVRVNWDSLGYLIPFPWSTFHLLVANFFTVWDHKPPELGDLLKSVFPSMHCLWQVLNKTCLMNFNFPSQIAYFFTPFNHNSSWTPMQMLPVYSKARSWGLASGRLNQDRTLETGRDFLWVSGGGRIKRCRPSLGPLTVGQGSAGLQCWKEGVKCIPHLESLTEIYPCMCTAPGTHKILKCLFTIEFTHISKPLGCSHLRFFSRYKEKEQKPIFKLFLVLVGFKDTFRIIVLTFSMLHSEPERNMI